MTKRTKREAVGVPADKTDTETADNAETSAVEGTTCADEPRPPSPSLLPDVDWVPSPGSADDCEH